MNKGLPFVGDDFLISIGLYILLFITLVFLIFKTGLASKESLNIPIILVLSGVISNLVDRLLRGGVIDFIDVKIWPVFNLADIFITLGLVWLCFVFLFRKA
jgi:signal peptidase II